MIDIPATRLLIVELAGRNSGADWDTVLARLSEALTEIQDMRDYTPTHIRQMKERMLEIAKGILANSQVVTSTTTPEVAAKKVWAVAKAIYNELQSDPG